MPSTAIPMRARTRPAVPAFSLVIIGLTAFLTVVDLFATQAILPALAARYEVGPSAAGVAVNAATLGMAIAGVLVALFSHRINRRVGIIASLFGLAIPTALLAHAPDLGVFAALRVAQGLLMSTAFTLTLAHLGERCTAAASAGAFSAYVTGNVASNLAGRLISANTTDHFGLASNFYLFAALNVAGGVLVLLTLRNTPRLAGQETMGLSALGTLRTHIANPALRGSFAIGFLILFAFIGTFSYVNFVLVRPPLGLAMTGIGLVYFVFAPSIATTPLAGGLVGRLGARGTLCLGIGIACLGLFPLLLGSLLAVLAGMTMVAAGTFLAQAVATGFVSRAATADRGAASGLYLASYFLGGLVGSAVLGQVFDNLGWPATVAAIGAALVLAAATSMTLSTPLAANSLKTAKKVSRCRPN